MCDLHISLRSTKPMYVPTVGLRKSLWYFIVRFPWDVECFKERSKGKAFRNYIPESTVQTLVVPTTILDLHGRILVWHLPDIFLTHRVVNPNSLRHNFVLKDRLGTGERCGKINEGLDGS